MKKFISVILIIAIVFSLTSCKSKNDINSSLGSDLSSDFNISSNDTLSSDESEVSSVIESSQEQSTTSDDIPVSSVPAESSKVTQTHKPVVPKKPTLDINRSRASSTDIGSTYYDGYYYYRNQEFMFGPFSLCRKKLNGGTEEVVLPDVCPSNFKVKDGKLYYISSGFFQCNADGSELKKMDLGILVTNFEIADDWIFIFSNIIEGDIDKRFQEFYLVKKDGSGLRKIQPKETDSRNLKMTYCGFNRGYLYYKFELFDTVESPEPAKVFEYRIDYRSSNPQLELLDTNITSPFGFDIELSHKCISYDTIMQNYNGKTYFMTLDGKKGTVVDMNTTDCLFYHKSKDYLVYQVRNNKLHIFKLVFVDINGKKKETNIPFPQKLSDNFDCGNDIYYRDTNYSTAVIQDNQFKRIIQYIVGPDGVVTELYNKNVKYF